MQPREAVPVSGWMDRERSGAEAAILNRWMGGNGGSTTNFFYNKLLISQYFAKWEQHLPIGGSAPLKFAMLISKRRMSGWAGGKKTILET